LKLFRDSNITTVHFIGICGTAMASVAAELHRAGFKVTGSDSNVYPPMSEFLYKHGVTVLDGFKSVNLPKNALIVVGNALSRGNPELEAALNAGYCLISLPELISRRYLTDRTPIVVAGTHGKTTTTAMIAHILRHSGRDPGWLIGGIPVDLDFPCYFGSGDEFVIEGDEYDSVWYDKRPKFFHYKPRMAVLTSVEFDHSDIYEDLNAVKAVFRRFVRLLPENGKLLVCGDDREAFSVAADALCNVETYGFNSGLTWSLDNIKQSGEIGIHGDINGPNGLTGSMRLSLTGEFNLKNALAALAISVGVGVDPDDALKALQCFRGVKRRLELLTEEKGIAVWEDFAHHPTAISAALSGLRRRYSGRRLWALLEPRSNTMARKYFTSELVEALAQADNIILAPVHRKERIPFEERLDTSSIANILRNRGLDAVAVDAFDEVVEKIEKNARRGDVILIMSNGGFGGIKERIVELIC